MATRARRAPARRPLRARSVKAHEHFLRDEHDLVTVLDVPAPLAALGAKLEVPTLEGPEDVHVRPGTQPGETIELRGRGMPVLRRPGRRGDLASS